MRATSIALCLACATAAHGESGPRLAAASNSGQGWLPQLATSAMADGVLDFRDAVYWDLVERDGVFAYDLPATRYPDILAEGGAGMSLTVNNGHPDYDAGHTPHSREAVAAFAAHAAQTVQRFPNIHTVEVGNEVNAANFVSGPVRDAGLDARAGYHLALLAATYEAVKAVRPEVRVLGGATHSIPGRYLGDLFALGGRDYMDALAIHPYTTPVEHLVREIAFLRSIPGAEGMPIEVTEFGWEGEGAAAAEHLVKGYCMFAQAGVERLVWYPLHPRGDGLAALFTRDGETLAAGRAHAEMRRIAEGRAMQAVAVDPFTYGCSIGPDAAPDHLILWGAEREVSVAPGIRVTDAEGRPVAAPLSLGASPLILSAPDGGQVRLGQEVRLGDQEIVADSYDQFSLPADGAIQGAGDPFERFARRGDQEIPLLTRPGQDRSGAPWHPYRGAAADGGLLLSSNWLVPSGGDDDPVEIVHRYRPATALAARLRIDVGVPERSEDGVTLQVLLGGREIAAEIVTDTMVLDLPIAMAGGEALEVAIGPGMSARGDATRYRITLLAAGGTQ